jgi:hypothetical protein
VREPTRSRRGARRPLVSWPLYRLLLLLSLLPPLVAALAVREPEVPPPPPRPVEFDGGGAATLAAALPSARRRAPGTDAAGNAAEWVEARLRGAGLEPRRRRFAATVPWRDEAVPMENVTAFRPGRRDEVVMVVAHRDASATDDNASGTGMLIELARELAGTDRERGLLFASTDGGTTGGQGAAELAERPPAPGRIVAAIVLDHVSPIAGTPIAVRTRPDVPRGTSPTLFAAARRAVVQATGTPAALPGAYDQLAGYGFPYALEEQGPLLARGVPAVTLAAEQPTPGVGFRALDPEQMGRVGLAVATLVAVLDAAPTVEPGGEPAVFLSGKVVRGWLAQVALLGLLVPPLACTLQMVARCRRRRLALAPALAAVGWRAGGWLAAVVAAWVIASAPGDLLPSADVAPQPGRTGATTAGMVLAILVGVLFWRFVSRPRLVARGPATPPDRTAGLVAALVALGASALALAAVNPFALIAILPAAHAWLWLPAAARLGQGTLFAAYAAGFAGSALVVVYFWVGLDAGSETLHVLAAMVASGYLSPAVSACLAVAGAAAAQLGALIADRYGPAHPPDPTV